MVRPHDQNASRKVGDASLTPTESNLEAGHGPGCAITWRIYVEPSEFVEKPEF